MDVLPDLRVVQEVRGFGSPTALTGTPLEPAPRFLKGRWVKIRVTVTRSSPVRVAERPGVVLHLRRDAPLPGLSRRTPRHDAVPCRHGAGADVWRPHPTPPGTPRRLEGFRFHDLRHSYASMLIAAGLDVKVVQGRLRHASATTTLTVYGHLWPGRAESSRAAVAVALAAREDKSRTVGVVG